MPASNLIDPNNRLLGWATNDFSLYGGLPAVTIGLPSVVPGSNGNIVSDLPASGDDRSANPDTGAAPISAGEQSFDTAVSNDTLSLSPTAFAPTPMPGATPASGDATGSAPQSDAAGLTGAGSFNPDYPSILGSQHGDAADQAGAGALAFELPVQSIATPAPLGIGDAVAPVVLGLADQISDLQSGMTGTLQSTVVNVDGLTATLPNAAGLGSADNLVTAADGFLGSDPAAGVSTLVSMVDSADAFDLTHGAADGTLTSSGPIIDTLADEAQPDALLGDAAHHASDDVLPTHIDHEGLGI